ncbi:hypothetical protein [Undibacterium hunanense]|nr:hypothetical protein [Undibacterium hunanense]
MNFLTYTSDAHTATTGKLLPAVQMPMSVTLSLLSALSGALL